MFVDVVAQRVPPRSRRPASVSSRCTRAVDGAVPPITPPVRHLGRIFRLFADNNVSLNPAQMPVRQHSSIPSPSLSTLAHVLLMRSSCSCAPLVASIRLLLLSRLALSRPHVDIQNSGPGTTLLRIHTLVTHVLSPVHSQPLLANSGTWNTDSWLD